MIWVLIWSVETSSFGASDLVYRLDLPPNTFNLSTQGSECFTGYHALYVQTVLLSILIMQVNNHCSKIKNIN
jgi:hypothetical protein